MSLATDMSDGIGGLSFVAQAPPGIGRLIRIPFYLETATAGFDAIAINAAAATLPGAGGTASLTSPAILMSAPIAVGTGNTAQLLTPQISWATLRIVGFECALSEGTPQNFFVALGGFTGSSSIMFQDLQIGGGANLFVHEDFAPADIYLAGQDSFSGLRDYPILKSPNVARVSVAVFSSAAATALPPAVGDVDGWRLAKIVTCNLVCEILQDDNYGSHIPGPYARKGAMVRRGGSFV